MKRIFWTLGLGLGSVFLAPTALAQTTGTVFGPEVDPDDKSAQLRVSFVPGGGLEDAEIAVRAHYQAAINDKFRWRAIVAGSDRTTGDWEPDYIQGELLWQTLERTDAGYSNGLRLDVRVQEGDERAHQIGGNWTNQWVLDGGWRVRALFLVDVEIGDRRRDGLFVETRAGISRRLENGMRVGVESFNDWGNSDAGFGQLKDQEHALGPAVSFPLEGGWSLAGFALFGLSDGADDSDFQVRLTRDY